MRLGRDILKALLCSLLFIPDLTPEEHRIGDERLLQISIDKILNSNRLDLADSPGECYASYFAEVLANWDRLSGDLRSRLAPAFIRPDNPESFYYKPGGLPYEYGTRHFKCHYTLTGPYRVPADDVSPADGVPDYVQIAAEAFERSLELLTDPDYIGYDFDPRPPDPPGDPSHYRWPEDLERQRGIRIPPTDYWSAENGGDERWDIYFMTGPWGAFTAGDYVVESQGSTSSVYSAYFAVNTKYYDWYGEFRGIEALKATCAHEFFHAVQYAYNVYMHPWFKEAASTWVETVAYPGGVSGEPDGFDYIGPIFVNWFSHPERSLEFFNGIHEYGDAIFLFYLSQKFGNDIVIEFFEDMVPGTFRYLFNFSGALARRGTNLGSEFKEFTVWNFFTDRRADLEVAGGGKYRRAGDLPPLAVRPGDVHSSYPFTVHLDRGAAPDHLGARYIRLLPDGFPVGRELSIKVDGDDIDFTSGRSIALLYNFGLCGWGAKVIEIDHGRGYAKVEEILPFYGSQEGQINVKGFGDEIDEVVLVLINLDPEVDGGEVSYSAGPRPDISASNLRASTDRDGTVTLSWDASGEGISGFKILRKNYLAGRVWLGSGDFLPEEALSSVSGGNSGDGYFVTDIIATLGGDARAFTDSTALVDLFSGSIYHYAVVPFDGTGLLGGPAVTSDPVFPEDSRPPTANLYVRLRERGMLELALVASEYLPSRDYLGGQPVQINAYFPDGTASSVELHPDEASSKRYCSRSWFGTLHVPASVPSGDIEFSVTMTDKGGNQVTGSSPILTGGTYRYRREGLPSVLVYPNPAKRDTKEMIFEVAEGTISSLRIYSLSGELIRDLAGSVAGGRRISWDIKNKAGKPVRSDVYLYIIESGGVKLSGKIAVVR